MFECSQWLIQKNALKTAPVVFLSKETYKETENEPIDSTGFHVPFASTLKRNVVILTKFSSLFTLEVVILTTSSATNDENLVLFSDLIIMMAIYFLDMKLQCIAC